MFSSMITSHIWGGHEGVTEGQTIVECRAPLAAWSHAKQILVHTIGCSPDVGGGEHRGWPGKEASSAEGLQLPGVKTRLMS